MCRWCQKAPLPTRKAARASYPTARRRKRRLLRCSKAVDAPPLRASNVHPTTAESSAIASSVLASCLAAQPTSRRDCFSAAAAEAADNADGDFSGDSEADGEAEDEKGLSHAKAPSRLASVAIAVCRPFSRLQTSLARSLRAKMLRAVK